MDSKVKSKNVKKYTTIYYDCWYVKWVFKELTNPKVVLSCMVLTFVVISRHLILLPAYNKIQKLSAQ